MHKRVVAFTRRTSLVTLLAMVASPAAFAVDAAWPNRSIRILVAAPAGGASDMIARTLAESLRRSMQQVVLVENKPGAGGIMAVETMLNAPHDGYTVVLSPNSLRVEAPYSYKFRFDPFKDLIPLAEVASVPLVLVTDPQLPIKSLSQMLAYVKANPGKSSYASYSPGTLSHIKGMQFNHANGLDMVHVGYKGSPPALQDVMSGQVQFMFDGLGTSLPLIQAGKLRPLAITSAERSPFLPDVPTLAESGYPGLSQIMGTSVWVPPDLPQQVQTKFRQALLDSISTQQVQQQLALLGMNAGNPALSQEELDQSLRRDYESTGQVLRSINYKP